MIEKFNKRFAIVKEKNEFLSGIITYPPFWEFKDDKKQALLFETERKAKIILKLIIQEIDNDQPHIKVIKLK